MKEKPNSDIVIDIETLKVMIVKNILRFIIHKDKYSEGLLDGLTMAGLIIEIPANDIKRILESISTKKVNTKAIEQVCELIQAIIHTSLEDEQSPLIGKNKGS